MTLHALLRKRNVASAIGWIGLAWLSPLFGPLLYFCFGINRVERRAQRLTRGRKPPTRGHGRSDTPRGSFAVLARAIGRITGTPTVPGKVTALLECGHGAYPRMLAAIDEAKVSVALSSYIFRDDSVGRQFIDSLARAHERGVAVRVLIDGFGGGFLLSRASRRLARMGVPTARHLHAVLPWKMPLLNLRLHKKILVLDGTKAFIGGLNIGAENDASTNPSWPVCDVQFEVEGPVVRQVMAAFREDWQFAADEILDGPEWFPDSYASGEVPARVISSGPDLITDRLTHVLISAINTASSSIRIVTPYFLPEEQLMTALMLAQARGVQVDIVLPAVSDHRMVHWAMTAHIRPLITAGCRIWHSGPPFDHSKLTTIDDAWSLVGSANWDARSLRLNFEITVEFYDGTLARRLASLIDGKRGAPVTLEAIDGRSPVVKIRDAAARLLMPYL